MITLSPVEAQLVRLATGVRAAAIQRAEAEFRANVAPVLKAHGVHAASDGEFQGQDDGSVVWVEHDLGSAL